MSEAEEQEILRPSRLRQCVGAFLLMMAALGIFRWHMPWEGETPFIFMGVINLAGWQRLEGQSMGEYVRTPRGAVFLILGILVLGAMAHQIIRHKG